MSTYIRVLLIGLFVNGAGFIGKAEASNYSQQDYRDAMSAWGESQREQREARYERETAARAAQMKKNRSVRGRLSQGFQRINPMSRTNRDARKSVREERRFKRDARANMSIALGKGDPRTLKGKAQALCERCVNEQWVEKNILNNNRRGKALKTACIVACKKFHREIADPAYPDNIATTEEEALSELANTETAAPTEWTRGQGPSTGPNLDEAPPTLSQSRAEQAGYISDRNDPAYREQRFRSQQGYYMGGQRRR